MCIPNVSHWELPTFDASHCSRRLQTLVTNSSTCTASWAFFSSSRTPSISAISSWENPPSWCCKYLWLVAKSPVGKRSSVAPVMMGFNQAVQDFFHLYCLIYSQSGWGISLLVLGAFKCRFCFNWKFTHKCWIVHCQRLTTKWYLPQSRDLWWWNLAGWLFFRHFQPPYELHMIDNWLSSHGCGWE